MVKKNYNEQQNQIYKMYVNGMYKVCYKFGIRTRKKKLKEGEREHQMKKHFLDEV